MLAICRGASLQGQVTSTTGEPVKNATVRLQRIAASPSQGQAAPGASVFNTTTDAAGNFVFESIDPGRYSIDTPQHPGYLRQAQAQTIVISAHQPASVTIKLTPESRIEGRVTNQAGEPFAEARVSAWRWSAAGPYLQLTAPGTNDVIVAADGSFAIGGLGAGHYFVSVRGAPRPNPRAEEQNTPSETDITTYFPGVSTVSSATLLKVARGAILQGIDIRVLRGVVYRINGRAVDAATGSTIPNAYITLFADGPQRREVASATTEDGAFQLTVAPGDYVVQARLLPARGPVTGDVFAPALFTDQRITVGKENIDDLVLRLSPGADIDGRFITEDTARQPAQPGPAPVTRLYSSGFNQAGQGQIQRNRDGSFAIHEVGPGEYTLGFAGLPAGTYVKSVRYGQQDVTDKAINVGLGAGGSLEILLSPHAADVTGIVRNSNGDAVPGVLVMLWVPGHAADSGALTDASGAFKVGNLAPGEYRAAAWEGNSPLPVNGFLNQFESQAVTAKLDQDSHERIEVPLIKQEAIDAALENVR
jgi:hypothetical protein